MIIRIMEEGQFRLDDAHLPKFEQLDEELHTVAQAGDAIGFEQVLGRLITFIKTMGVVVPFTEIIPSDVVVPAENMTLAEAVEILPLTAETPEHHHQA